MGGNADKSQHTILQAVEWQRTELPTHQAGKWVEEEFDYSGEAQFFTVDGEKIAQGNAKVVASPTGALEAHILDFSGSLPPNDELLYGRMEIGGASGSLLCRKPLIFQRGFNSGTGKKSLKLALYEVTYTPNGTPSGKFRYFVMALSNYALGFYSQGQRGWLNFPIRAKMPIIRAFANEVAAHHYNGILTEGEELFEVRSSLGDGFVESHPDYAKRIDALTNGTETHAITAFLIGECVTDRHPSGAEEWLSHIMEKYPGEMLDALWLAGRTLVGASTIDIRDENSTLIHRIHYGRQSRPFSSSRPILFEAPQHGLPKFIECVAARCNESKRLVDIGEVATCLGADLTPELSLAQVFALLDTLAQRSGVEPMVDFLELISEENSLVSELIRVRDDLASLVQKAVATCAANEDARAKEVGSTVAERNVAPVFKVGGGVGHRLAKFVESLDLEDRDAWASRSKIVRGKNLRGAIEKVRNIIVHGTKQPCDFDKNAPLVMAISTYLQDFLVRIVFNELAYKGWAFMSFTGYSQSPWLPETERLLAILKDRIEGSFRI